MGAPVSLVDVLPTVLSLLGVRPSAPTDGIDLSPAWHDEGGLPPAHSSPRGRKRGTWPRATGTTSSCLDPRSGTAALFDLLEDPQERVDLADRRPGVRNWLRGELALFMESRVPDTAGRASCFYGCPGD